jgi:hypothetical protein
MQTGLNSISSRPGANDAIPSYGGRRDIELAQALMKVSPQAQVKAHKTATYFEAVFLI